MSCQRSASGRTGPGTAVDITVHHYYVLRGNRSPRLALRAPQRFFAPAAGQDGFPIDIAAIRPKAQQRELEEFDLFRSRSDINKDLLTDARIVEDIQGQELGFGRTGLRRGVGTR
jgi:hypothetical protein